MILKAQNRSTRTKTCDNDNFPKFQPRKPANNRMTYSTTLFLKLTGIYIYIYRLSSYLTEEWNTNGRMMYMEIVSVTFENAQKNINAVRG